MRQGIHSLADCRVSDRTNDFFSPLSEDFRYETGNSFPGGLLGKREDWRTKSLS